MAYSQDLKKSARRHLKAAEVLDNPGPSLRRDVAGYLYGIAGECALKELMRASGMRPTGRRHDDPFYAHFPDLKAMLRDSATGRYHGRLRAFSESAALMNEWDTDMRYAPGSEITNQRVDRWQTDAKALIAAMEET